MLFFFFKQKTAYGMRIRDWSSDVCSSDLVGEAHGVELDPPRPRREIPGGRRVGDFPALVEQPEHRLHVGQRLLDLAIHETEEVERQEIGRASCRERVCKYV